MYDNIQPGNDPLNGMQGRPVPQAPPVPVFTSSQIRAMARARLKGKLKILAVPMLIYTVISMLPSLIYSGVYISDIKAAGLFSSDSAAYADTVQSVMGLSDGSGTTGIFSSFTSFMGNFVTFYQLFLTGVFGIVISTIALKVIRNEDINPSDVTTGFVRYTQSLCSGFMVMFFTFLWRCLFILPGSFILGFGMAASAMSSGLAYIIVFLGFAAMLAGAIGGVIFTMRYDMTYFLAADNRYMRASEAVARSVIMMRKRVGQYFMLILSFIGWLILASIPLTAALTVLTVTSSPAGHITAVILMIVFMAVYAPVMLYIETSKAIYYSTLTGNFRTNDTPREMNDEYIPDDNDNHDL